MTYTKTNWVDEVLDGAERFKVLDDAGAAADAFADLAECRIQLKTSVTTSGTALDATKLNKLEAAMETIHADDAITEIRIKSGAVTNAKIGSGAVTPVKTSFFNTAASGSKMYFGGVSSSGSAVRLPSGWSCEQLSTGVYRVTHNLSTTNCIVIVTTANDALEYVDKFSASFTVQTSSGGVAVNTAFDFIMITY